MSDEMAFAEPNFFWASTDEIDDVDVKVSGRRGLTKKTPFLKTFYYSNFLGFEIIINTGQLRSRRPKWATLFHYVMWASNMQEDFLFQTKVPLVHCWTWDYPSMEHSHQFTTLFASTRFEPYVPKKTPIPALSGPPSIDSTINSVQAKSKNFCQQLHISGIKTSFRTSLQLVSTRWVWLTLSSLSPLF